MKNVKLIFKAKKYGFPAVAVFVVAVFFANLLEKIFDRINDHLINNPRQYFGWIVDLLNYKMPIYSLILGALFVLLIYWLYKFYKIKNSGLILEAKYGKNNKYIDITNELNSMVKDKRLTAVISNDIAGDPLPGVVKEGIIKYKHDGKIEEIIVPERGSVDIS